MLISDISTIVTDRITTETIATDKLNRCIAEAVRQYSRYNPIITTVLLSTLVDQASYSLAAYHAMIVIDCFWWPGGQITDVFLSGHESVFLEPDPVYYHQPSGRVINQINGDAQSEAWLGKWEQQGQNIVISPTPTVDGANDLEVICGCLHIINADGTAYTTIPDEDLGILADLTTAVYLQSRAAELALEPDYAEGQQRVTHHYQPTTLHATVRELQRSVIDKYGGAGLAVAR
jgi:hypothetical protein